MAHPSLSRRTLLRGFGTALALPMMEAMAAPAAKTAASSGATRMVYCYVPNGIIMEHWTPNTVGKLGEFQRVMKPLEPLREKLTVLSGLTHNTGRALGDGPGDHARAASTVLTGVHPRNTASANISLGVSADQIAAETIGKQTRLASLELTLESGRQAGNCDSGYSCAYSNNISWRSATTPNPPEYNPRIIFERMFGNADPTETAASRARRERYNRSILDFALEDAASLQGALGATDRRKLDEYLTAVREVEMRIAQAEKLAANAPNLATLAPGFEKPAGVPVDYAEYAKLMFDLMALALQTDSTRVMTLMMAREGSNRPYREIGISDGHHGLTHHRNNAEWIEKIAQINEYHVKQFAYFIQKLDSIQDGDATLLDRSMIVYGSGLADGNRHTHHELPMVIAGGGNRQIRTGRHVQFPKETPLTNLYLTLLEAMQVPAGALGDSTGRLNHVIDL
ncbi:MAG: DUF1552 domain-containing protein [Bryobacterales bacterium]|nr:DUF1552 domain-containing protein [Bryobacterales bacterium]